MEYTKEWTVTTDGSDLNGRITLPYLAAILQETATLHAELLGWGYSDLSSEGLQWVLSRQWIKIHRYPVRQEKFKIATWPSAKGGLTWSRDFRITGNDGSEIGVASSLWFVMDRKTRRPSPSSIGKQLDIENSERVREKELKPLPPVEGGRSAVAVKAGYFDIDIHQHINNVRYLTWMLTGIDSGFMRNHVAREIEINFLAEGFIDNELEVLITGGNGQFRHSLYRRSDGIELSRMSTEWIPVTD